MTIVEKITNSISAAVKVDGKPIPVYYHDEPTLNFKTSEMSFPCVLFQLLTRGNVIRDGGQLRERVTAAVFFVDLTEFDFEALENEKIIDRCKERCFAWLSSLNADAWMKLYRLNNTERVYDETDDVLTGFGVSADLDEVGGYCVNN